MCALSLKETNKPPVGDHAATLRAAAAQVSEVILGKEHVIRLALACMLARGHLLIEDIPGVGKTLLAHALARAFGLSFQRIQFTSDLLPADVLGVSIYDRNTQSFEFHPGPIFTQVVLADEVNRATPKAQSALLEAMEERQVTQEGLTRALPDPFFVIATQNPGHQIGTFPLPESQLDRFLMRIELGYPHQAAERALLTGPDRRDLVDTLQPCSSAEQLQNLLHEVPGIHVSDALVDYVQALIAYSRSAPEFETGLSPRAGLAIVRAAQAWAMMDGRAHVLPEDVQAICACVIDHRLHTRNDAAATSSAAENLLQNVPVP
jgi:MoxR-like ATPase